MAKSLIGMLAVCLGLTAGAPPARAAESAHDFAFIGIDGAPLPLSAFRGKALLIVNTASQCGFTPQYDSLQKLWADYRDRDALPMVPPSRSLSSFAVSTFFSHKKSLYRRSTTYERSLNCFKFVCGEEEGKAKIKDGSKTEANKGKKR